MRTEKYELHHGDCREVMATMAENSVDAIVTDPPYGLSFMGKEWDHGVPGVQFWREALRVAKPGAHLLAFGGTRTFHRLTCAIEDAGWEIRDCVMWVYGSGFPKSHDVSKAIDKAAGAEREVVGKSNRHVSGKPEQRTAGLNGSATFSESVGMEAFITAPATDAARQWAGWGTALKPAWEPVIVARKPLMGTVAANVLEHGTGAINVDGCRVGTDGGTTKGNPPKSASNGVYGHGINGACDIVSLNAGRWPANIIHDGSDEVVALFPVTSSGARNGPSDRSLEDESPSGWGGTIRRGGYAVASTGSAARFFYCAKASKRDRDEGLQNPPQLFVQFQNHHPTVKPTNLMRYLCRLVTPPGGVVLDPFMGSGSTGKAAILEGFRFIGIDLNPEYIEIARGRIAQAAGESTTLF